MSKPMVLVLAGSLVLSFTVIRAQAPRRGAASPLKVDANMAELMRGIFYPASNVIFAAQYDFREQPKPRESGTSPNPLTSDYGGWVAVESAGLAIAEAAQLLMVPGRTCANGHPVPVDRADWAKFTADLRTAGLAMAAAARKQPSTDEMAEITSVLADSCTACHQKYREKKGGRPDRCLP